MSDKNKYFESLSEIEQWPLFLTDSINQLSEEINTNCIYLSIPAGIQVQLHDLLAFLRKVRLNRQLQLQNSGLAIDLVYYVWHDELAGQLRFNFLNSSHQNLPFGCTVSLVENEAEIVSGFLNSSYLQGIPWDEFATVDDEINCAMDDSNIATFTCKVYQEIIPNLSTKPPQSLR